MSDEKNVPSDAGWDDEPAEKPAAPAPAAPEAPVAEAAPDAPAPEEPATAPDAAAPPPAEDDPDVDWDAADLASAEAEGEADVEAAEEEEAEDEEAVVRARRQAAEERLRATRARGVVRPSPEKPSKAKSAKAAAEKAAAHELAPPAAPDPSLFKWYVVHTYSGYENKAKQGLEQRVKTNHLDHKFNEIVIPTESVVELKRGRKRTTSRKFFPGYILVKMVLDDETWHLVKNTPKVTSFLGEQDGRKPSPVTESEILELSQQMTEGASKPKPRVLFEEGENVRVIDGPFLNFSGIVEEVKPEKGKLKVHISIFGRPTPVELDFMQVEKA
jgi:transcriptional antiterminator NusG